MGAKVRDSPEPVSVTCTGGFEIAVPLDRAGHLFTPEGEREWVEGWDPRYPDPHADRFGVGTVFVTDGPAGEVTWVITAAQDGFKSYARWDRRGIVTVVEVELEAAGADATRVGVTYRMTALDDSVRAEPAEFEAGYDEYMEEWRAAIVPFLEGGHG